MNRFEKNFERKTGINFNTFYNEQYEKLINYLNKKTMDRDLSEDIAEDAFMQCLNKIDNYNQDKSQIHTWLFTIAKHYAIKDWKDKQKLPTVSMDKEVKNSATLELFLPYHDNKRDLHKHEIIRKKAAFMKECIYALPEKQNKYKTVLILRHMDAMSYEEIAIYLNLNLSTVKSQIKKGREIIIKNSTQGLRDIDEAGIDDFKL